MLFWGGGGYQNFHEIILKYISELASPRGGVLTNKPPPPTRSVPGAPTELIRNLMWVPIRPCQAAPYRKLHAWNPGIPHCMFSWISSVTSKLWIVGQVWINWKFNYYIGRPTLIYKRQFYRHLCLRSYHVENTGSRPITEVKERRAWLLLGWVTAWEHQVW